jgi:glycerophosphoryl diester phosphodiesterase
MKESRMMIIGHRGAAALEPENTLISIERAMDIGVDAVEIDVHLSKDK